MNTHSSRCSSSAPANRRSKALELAGNCFLSIQCSSLPHSALARTLRHGEGKPLVLCYLVLALGFAATAQDYSINWHSIDGGGGTSTGQVHTVSGTIGQPDAVTMNSGDYTLSGGFWGVVAAVQTPGAPLLRVTYTTTNTIVVAWPNPSTGFTLQQKSNLSPGAWISTTNSPVIVGREKQVVVAPPVGNRFYRLSKP